MHCVKLIVLISSIVAFPITFKSISAHAGRFPQEILAQVIEAMISVLKSRPKALVYPYDGQV